MQKSYITWKAVFVAGLLAAAPAASAYAQGGAGGAGGGAGGSAAGGPSIGGGGMSGSGPGTMGGTTGVSLLVSGPSRSGLKFGIDVDPLLGSVVIRDERGR